MQKRRIIIGTYDTALDGLWTLSAWTFSPASYRQKLVEVPGRDGHLDVSTVLTGSPVYDSRTLTVSLESSEGNRLERRERIADMINRLDGLVWNIILPDDDLHYIRGRVRVAKKYNDPAHCAVTVTATCDPWLYALHETTVSLTATSVEQTATLFNHGRLAVALAVTVMGGDVQLVYGESSWNLSPGVHTFPDIDIALTPGEHPVTYSGTGHVTLTYREAVLE